jgi:CheY-like chemotaxis protein
MRPHLLIIDIGLPEEDGYTLIRKARAFLDERGYFIPAVALTAYSRLEDQKRALAAGFDVHMSKPPLPTELIEVVARLTGRIAAQEKSNLISRTAKTANEQ